MSHATEYIKSNMATASVLLGLTPVILATLGSSTTELSLLSSHRPVLAFLLVLGSPAVNPIRSYDYPDPKVELRQKKWRWDFPKRSQMGNIVCVMVELLFAISSIANLADLCRMIAFNTIAVVSCDFSDVVVAIWIGLAVITHLSGLVTFSTRFEMVDHGTTEPRSTYTRIRGWLRSEFSPCVTHTKHELKWGDQNKYFIVCSFFTSVYTMAHLTGGILILSSLSFVGMSTISLLCSDADCVGTRYATMIVARFMVSTIICRIIVAYELAGITAAEETREKGPTEGQFGRP
jgi:hypothetical protein